jgi:hypothetical protein
VAPRGFGLNRLVVMPCAFNNPCVPAARGSGNALHLQFASAAFCSEAESHYAGCRSEKGGLAY